MKNPIQLFVTNRSFGWPGSFRFFPLILSMLCLLVCAAPAAAQQTTATVVGNVVDSSGASVVGAAVKITNTATNTVRETVSDGAGVYTLPQLPAGKYNLSVEMPGFQGEKIDGIVLESSQTARQDFKISAGKVSETVTVQSGALGAVLQTENGAVGEVIDGKKIVDLPLNGRNFIQLAQLIPGVNTGRRVRSRCGARVGQWARPIRMAGARQSR